MLVEQCHCLYNGLISLQVYSQGRGKERCREPQPLGQLLWYKDAARKCLQCCEKRSWQVLIFSKCGWWTILWLPSHLPSQTWDHPVPLVADHRCTSCISSQRGRELFLHLLQTPSQGKMCWISAIYFILPYLEWCLGSEILVQGEPGLYQEHNYKGADQHQLQEYL